MEDQGGRAGGDGHLGRKLAGPGGAGAARDRSRRVAPGPSVRPSVGPSVGLRPSFFRWCSVFISSPRIRKINS